MGALNHAVSIGEGHVFHGRGDAIDHRFKYPAFFLFFRCDEEVALREAFRGPRSLLSFRIEDYLAGRSGPIGEVVREFLRARCQYDAEEVWLHTLPRMFGYAFNPVSFWLCRRAGVLDAVLCEVNNTFGERHFYWLRRPDGPLGEDWIAASKHFHVSPFMPVEGHYRFRFRVSVAEAMIEINYHGADGKLRLATWIRGGLAPLAERGGLGILLRYGWLTPLVVLRIHAQAIRLFFKKAKIFGKPNPPSQEVTCSSDP